MLIFYIFLVLLNNDSIIEEAELLNKVMFCCQGAGPGAGTSSGIPPVAANLNRLSGEFCFLSTLHNSFMIVLSNDVAVSVFICFVSEMFVYMSNI